MGRAIFVIAVFSLNFVLAPPTNPGVAANSRVKKNASAPTITITKLNVSDKILEVSWEIRNVSEKDAWILAGLGESGADISAFMDEDDRTLLLSRRLDVPARPERASFPVCNGRYVRLPARQTQAESVSLAIPVYPEYGIGVGGRKAQGLEYATRLTIEIGYYTGDLPGMIRRLIEKDEKNPRIIRAVDGSYSNSISGWFGGLLGSNRLNECVRCRDDEILIPYTSQAFTGEEVLRVTARDLRIPYEEKVDVPIFYPPDLTPCTRVEIQYQPSILEFFFPYTGQQSLLSSVEKEYLKASKTITVETPDNLKAFADDVKNVKPWADIARQRSVAHVVGYRDDQRLMSFPIYNDDCIVTECRCLFRPRNVNGFRSLRVLTPQVQAIELRVRCAANLKNVWYRLRLYGKAAGSLRFAFLRRLWSKPCPPTNTWCDSMLRSYSRAIEISHENLIRPYICPSVGQGKCHYAMNPNCKLDSPLDMVLLFETKAGWNQHGGPELFTFDNHEPKGGCVLLNDGTVKFIRTKEELQELRWK